MSDILIQGMEMPTSDDDLRIIIGSDGSVHRIIGWAISEKTEAKAMGIPPHGDLIERDKLPHYETFSIIGKRIDVVDLEDVKNVPVIVEANND